MIGVGTGIEKPPSKPIPRTEDAGGPMGPSRHDQPHDMEERSLLARIARRDRRAFETLYDRYSRSVYSLALNMLRDPTAAQDVTQEVFLSIWQAAREFDPTRGSPRSWLLALAHHKSVDAVRRQRLRNTEPLEDLRAEAGDVVEETMRRLEHGRVREVLLLLSPEQRQAIVLAYYGGYTHQEIASRIGVPLGTAKTRIRDGMLRLRAALGHEEVSR